MRTWKCLTCGHEARVGYELLAEIGTPICGQPDCPDADNEMELLPEPRIRGTEVHLVIPCGKKDLSVIVPRLERAGSRLCKAFSRRKDGPRIVVNPSKPQLRLIVEMYGGTIEGVYQDSSDVQVTDIVFTEDGKYLEGEEDRDVGDVDADHSVAFTALAFTAFAY